MTGMTQKSSLYVQNYGGKERQEKYSIIAANMYIANIM